MLMQSVSLQDTPFKTLSATSGLIRTVVRADIPDAEANAMHKLGVALTATAGGPSLTSQIGSSATMETATPMPMLSSSEVRLSEPTVDGPGGLKSDVRVRRNNTL